MAEEEKMGEFIRKLREESKMPLRKLSALLDIDQSTLSKIEKGTRPIQRNMLPIIAATFNVDEKELVVKFMSRQVAYTLFDEQYAMDILIAAEAEVKYNKTKPDSK